MAVLTEINALVLGLFILSTIALVVVRQVRACIAVFIAQSLLLAASAIVLGSSPFSWHLTALAAVTIVSKAIVIPWLIHAFVPADVEDVREERRSLAVPTALLAALGLTLLGYFFASHLIKGAANLSPGNVSMGLSALLVALLALSARTQAVPQLLGLLSMENGAFLAGIAIAPDFPLIAELAIAFDVPLLTFIVVLLARLAYRHLGSTEVGALSNLREGPQ